MPPSGILHTEAIVLRTIDYSETSRIVTLFTREEGKMGVIAKGARAAKSRFGSTLEPMSRIAAIIHCRPGRDLQILSDASHVAHLPTLRMELDRMESGFRMIELLGALLPDGQANADAYGLLTASLTALDGTPGRASNVWPFFQIRLATILGFGPSFDGDLVKALDQEFGILDLRSGRIDHQSHEGWTAYRTPRSVLRAFAVLSRADLSDVLRMELDPSTSMELNDLVLTYLRHHLEESYPTRSARVFAQIASRR